MAFAERTKTPVDVTRSEIEKTLKRYGADRFAYFTEAGRSIIVFESNDRRIRFDLPVPEGETDKDQQITRQRWRALLLCIKAKLEAVESKIESFEEAFLAHVVMPDGMTVGQHTIKSIGQAYTSNKMVALLPPPAEKP